MTPKTIDLRPTYYIEITLNGDNGHRIATWNAKVYLPEGYITQLRK